jgi:hypothetical protein
MFEAIAEFISSLQSGAKCREPEGQGGRAPFSAYSFVVRQKSKATGGGATPRLLFFLKQSKAKPAGFGPPAEFIFLLVQENEPKEDAPNCFHPLRGSLRSINFSGPLTCASLNFAARPPKY